MLLLSAGLTLNYPHITPIHIQAYYNNMGKVFYVFSVLNFLLVTCTAEKAMETMVATWEGVVIAESGNCVVVEGNQYVNKNDLEFA